MVFLRVHGILYFLTVLTDVSVRCVSISMLKCSQPTLLCLHRQIEQSGRYDLNQETVYCLLQYVLYFPVY